MKKLIMFFTIILLVMGCNEKQNKVDIIRLNDNNYLSGHELDNSKEVFLSNYNKNLYDLISNKIKKSGISLNEEFDSYNFSLFVNESGKLDKIIVLKEPDDKITSIMTDVLSNQTFEIATKDGKPVKYRFDWNYTSEYRIAVEQMPEPIGGLSAIQKNIHYPEIARRAGIEGKVYILAFINEAGNVVTTKVLKGIGAGCDEAAAEAVRKIKFKPGMQRGIPVKVQVTVPILFKLSDKK